MSRATRPALAITIALASLLASCGGEPISGPPELRLGRDECRECGMLIYEDRCAAALLLESSRGREHALFDDLGCMLDFESAPHEGAAVIGRFVRDYSERAWLNADDARILFADPDRLATPMASGLVAFGSDASAHAEQTRVSGQLLSFEQAAAARAQRKADRLTPETPDPNSH